MLLLLASSLSSAGQTAPGMGLTFGFEPRFGNYTALNDTLLDYDFTPVESAFLPAWGLRGRVFLAGGPFISMSMTYGLAVAEGAIPTVSTLIESTGGAGYRHDSGWMVSMDAGLSVLSQSVASSTDGGALIYMGPVIHPRIGWSRQFGEPMGSLLAIVVGGTLHRPVGSVHSIPLWEESFDRNLIGALTIGIESGVGLTTGAR
ncbi:MAG: hypothetical protein ACI8RZ_002581 [Myxococcota bacterium]|jgi:hypothetical protein